MCQSLRCCLDQTLQEVTCSPFIMEAKQFLVSPPLKFRLDRVPIDVFKTNCSENDAIRYFEHLQRPDASGRRSKVSYVPSESERIDLK